MWDLAILGGNIVTPTESVIGNIYIRDGKIGAVTQSPLGEPVAETVDAKGLDVFAGFIDTHVHSRDGGALHKETFYHSTRAAAMGGLTTVFEMPNAVPAVSNLENLQIQIENLTPKAHVDFAMWGLCVGGLNNHHLQAMSDAGVVAFKFFWGYAIKKSTYGLIYNVNPSDTDIIPPLGEGEVYEIFKAVEKTGKLIGIHAENASLIDQLTKTLQQNQFANEYEMLLACRPNLAEEMVVNTAISYCKDIGVRLHILHASAEESVDLVAEAQKKGLPVTMETCPHYLFLTDKDFERVGTRMKGYPPVRRQKDQDKLWQGIQDGVVTNICSDHAPHTAEEKQGGLFEIPAGMCGVQSLVPLMLGAVSEGKITKQQLAVLLSEGPAKLYGLYPQKGSLQVGTDADITLVDFGREMTIREEELQSVSKVTAFDGFTVQGVPVATIVRGRVVMRNGEIVSQPCGKFLKA